MKLLYVNNANLRYKTYFWWKHTQIHQYMSTSVYQIHQHQHQVYQCTSVPVYQCTSVPVYQCISVPVYQCTSVYMKTYMCVPVYQIHQHQEHLKIYYNMWPCHTTVCTQLVPGHMCHTWFASCCSRSWPAAHHPIACIAQIPSSQYIICNYNIMLLCVRHVWLCVHESSWLKECCQIRVSHQAHHPKSRGSTPAPQAQQSPEKML